MISQYPREKEHLFPPLTMLKVISVQHSTEIKEKRLQRYSSADDRFAEKPAKDEEATTTKGQSVSFTRIIVQPTFV
jgi:hypothetical protein